MARSERSRRRPLYSVLALCLHAAGNDVAVDLALAADEDDSVPGRIAGVPFHLLVRDREPGPAGEDALAVGDDGDVVIALDLKRVGLERVRLTATADVGIVGLHQRLEPLADGGRGIT